MGSLRFNVGLLVGCAVLHSTAIAQNCPLDLYRPACGKVCKLVCGTKKLVSIGYGNDCKQICLPCPSKPGCEHCAVCCGPCKSDPCSCCQSAAPKFEFCWRDWFACGCSKPRSVKVLTKYQMEKTICWYHWEVVDAGCCDCVSQLGQTGEECIIESPATQIIFKMAPSEAAVGEVLSVSDEESSRLATMLKTDLRGSNLIDSSVTSNQADQTAAN
jgi:hypothetical protein